MSKPSLISEVVTVALPVRVAAGRADGERETPHGLLAQQRVFAGQQLRACAASCGYVDGFIVHGSSSLWDNSLDDMSFV